MRIHTFTEEELADQSLGAILARPQGIIPGVPYLLTESPTFMGMVQTTGFPLTELRDALAALPPPPGPKTVEEWNRKRRAEIDAAIKGAVVEGLECPKCGGTLKDTQPGILLMSNPAQKRLDCPNCHHIDYIIA